VHRRTTITPGKHLAVLVEWGLQVGPTTMISQERYRLQSVECGPGMNTSLKVPYVHIAFTLFGNVKVNRGVSAMKIDLEVMVRM
jgi:hypothetical protein